MRNLMNIKGFVPYVVMLFLNAFVDLGHKIVIQNTIFKMYDGQQQVILTAIVNALILLPYIFLFTPAGFLSDKYPKHTVMRYTALVEVFTVLLVIAAYYFGWFWCAFALTLSMAIQSAFYSPAKYGYIRELVGENNLAAGNGVVQAVTIVAILMGTLVFSALFEWMLQGVELQSTAVILHTIYPLGIVLLVVAVLEWLLAYLLPAKRETDQRLQFVWPEYIRAGYLKKNLHILGRKPVIALTILGLVTFWSTSQVVLAVFPAFAKATLAETNTLFIQGILACTGIGIMAGSLFAGRVSKNRIELGLMPLGAIGFAFCLGIIPNLHSAVGLALVFVLAGFLGGLYIVPLNALMQYHASLDETGVVLAANNWVQNIAMLVFLLLTIVLSVFGINSKELFYCMMVSALLPALYTVYRLPQSLTRLLALLYCRFTGKLQVSGFEHLPSDGPALLFGRFRQWTDSLFIQLACPRRVRFILLDLAAQAASRQQRIAGCLIETVATHQQVLSLGEKYLSAGEMVCVLDKKGDVAWLSGLQGKLAMSSPLLLPVYLDIGSNVQVLIGKPLSLAVSAGQWQLALAGLEFEQRKKP